VYKQRPMELVHAYGALYLTVIDCPAHTDSDGNTYQVPGDLFSFYSHVRTNAFQICPHTCCGPQEYIQAAELIYNEAFNPGRTKCIS